MIDFLGIFDGILSAASIGKSATEISDDDSDKSSQRTDDRVEKTKATTHKIIEKRKHEIKEKRNTQVIMNNQHRHQHKR